MPFQIKDFASIAASMVNYAKATGRVITDFTEGSVTRTVMDASAIELDQFYQQALGMILDAIPVATFNTFNFVALPAIDAFGLIRVTITAQTVTTIIPAGTIFTRADGAADYASAADVTILAGSTTADVLVSCTAAGVLGNMEGGQTFSMSAPPNGFVSATNLAAFITGREAETEDQREARFVQYIASLARSTPAAIRYGLTTAVITDGSGNPIEQVRLAQVDEPYTRDTSQPIGLVNCYIHNGVGSTSDALLAQATQVVLGYTDASGNLVAGYKAAGTKCVVYKATEDQLNVTGVVTVLPGFDEDDTVDAVAAGISDYLVGLDIHTSALFGRIEAIGMDTPGVANFVMSAPTADVAAAIGHKIMPGTLDVTGA